jgi:phytoene synthase
MTSETQDRLSEVPQDRLLESSAPVLVDVSVEESYAACREIAKREAKNFYYSFVALPKHKSDAMCAVYAFMRKADDLSDDESKSHAQRRVELAAWVDEWHRAEGGEPATDIVFPALLDAKERFGISSQLLDQLIAGTAMDLETPVRPKGYFDTYQTFDELYRYCYLVASVVGLVCIRIFGYSDPRAEKLAEQTGIAFQLTNILRDVKEDAERGRIYLPLDQLARYDVSVDQVAMLAGSIGKMQQHHKAMLAETSQKAERYYQAANELLTLIEPDSRPALWVLVTIYHRLLLRIQSKDYDVFSERVSVPNFEKVAVLVQGILKVAWYRITFWKRLASRHA